MRILGTFLYFGIISDLVVNLYEKTTSYSAKTSSTRRFCANRLYTAVCSYIVQIEPEPTKKAAGLYKNHGFGIFK